MIKRITESEMNGERLQKYVNQLYNQYNKRNCDHERNVALTFVTMFSMLTMLLIATLVGDIQFDCVDNT